MHERIEDRYGAASGINYGYLWWLTDKFWLAWGMVGEGDRYHTVKKRPGAIRLLAISIGRTWAAIPLRFRFLTTI